MADTGRPKAIMSWSSGKDSAWTLHEVQKAGDIDVVGLVTTLNESADRVAMHGVRSSLLRAQADALELPLHEVGLPARCSNDEYERRLGEALTRLRDEQGVGYVIFGDLFLEDIRSYREAQMDRLDLEPVFPIFGRDTERLARTMIDSGMKAWLTCVDSDQLDPVFSGRAFDLSLLDELPEGVDPCGENGEFHTLVTAAPNFGHELQVQAGESHDDGRFFFTDFMEDLPE